MTTLSRIQDDVPAAASSEVKGSPPFLVDPGQAVPGSECVFDRAGDVTSTEIVRRALGNASVALVFIGRDSYSRQIGSPDLFISTTDLHYERDLLLALRESGYAVFTAASSGGDVYHPTVIDLDPDLKAALQDLEGVIEEAREDDFPEPTSVAILNARRLLNKLYDLSPQRYVVYPMDDGEVVIDGGRPDRRLCIFCNSDGTVSCLGWIDGERRRLEASSNDSIPTEFLVKTLTQPDGY